MQSPRAREILFNVTLSSVVSVFSVVTFLSAAAAQSRPAVDRGAASIYRQLLPQIERIRIFDHHAHPAFPNDPDVDAAPPPLGASPLRMREDNLEPIAAAHALFGFPFADLSGSHATWLVEKKAALRKQFPGSQYFDRIL